MWEKLEFFVQMVLSEQWTGLPVAMQFGAVVLLGICGSLLAMLVLAVWQGVRRVFGLRAAVRLRRMALVALAAVLLVLGVRRLLQPYRPADDWFSGLTLNQTASPQLQAETALLIDLTGQQILYQKNTADHIAPASTAKLLTALTVWEVCDPQETVTVGKELARVAFDASRAGLQQGDALTVYDLTAAMLLPSGNDAAYALAAHAGRALAGEGCTVSQALEAFRKAMNQTAKALGAGDSRFVTPDGYDADRQYTTAQDLARIARAFLQNEALAALAAVPAMTVPLQDGRSLELQNTNLLLHPDSEWYTPSVTGLKTGRSGDAGCCLVAAARQGDTQLLCVVMGSTEEGRWADTRALLALAP